MSVFVEGPGLFTTVQDLGRPGYQAYGVPPGGAMDPRALRIANLLVGNDQGAAALEITITGPALHFGEGRLLAIGGADLGASVGATEIPPWHAFWVPPGSELRFGASRTGCRAYLAVAGGIDVPEVLASRSTYTPAGFGGLAGRSLRAGDVLALGEPGDLSTRVARAIQAQGSGVRIARVAPSRTARSLASDVAEVRLISGTHQSALAADSLARLHAATFRVSARSDRMGYLLEGASLQLRHPIEVDSEGVAFGTVQLPPGGEAVVLMADRQTTGGYPRIGEVASVDLPLLAQLRPGDPLRFRPCSVDEAQAQLAAREREIRRLAAALGALYR